MKLKKNKKGGVFVKVGYAILYEDCTLTISKKHTILQTPIYIDYGEFDDNKIPWYHEIEFIKNVQIIEPMKVTCLAYWFYNCVNLKQLIDFQNLDVTECTFFTRTFYGCESLIDVDLKDLCLKSETIFLSTFKYCIALENVSLPTKLSKINNKMFGYCNDNLKIHWKDKIYTYQDLLEYAVFN